jgi:hypothetical protein
MTLPTSMTIRAMRAGIVADEIARHPEAILSIDDVANLPRLAGWAPTVLQVAIADLVGDGILVDDCRGVPLVKRRP